MNDFNVGDCLVFHVFIDLGRFEERVQALDVQSQQIRDMLDPDLQKYICVSCGNQYKTVGHLRRHLKDKHLWDFIKNDTEEDKKPHRIAIYRASLMKCLLLLKDTNDGDRIMTNAKFQMLLSGVSRHTKYQIWLFRFWHITLAYKVQKMLMNISGTVHQIFLVAPATTFQMIIWWRSWSID